MENIQAHHANISRREIIKEMISQEVLSHHASISRRKIIGEMILQEVLSVLDDDRYEKKERIAASKWIKAELLRRKTSQTGATK